MAPSFPSMIDSWEKALNPSLSSLNLSAEEDSSPVPVVDIPACSTCERTPASLRCQECSLLFCAPCSQDTHSRGVRKTHTVRPLDKAPSPEGAGKLCIECGDVCEECDAVPATVKCKECSIAFCTDCSKRIHSKGVRKTHTLTPYGGNCSPDTEEDHFPRDSCFKDSMGMDSPGSLLHARVPASSVPTMESLKPIFQSESGSLNSIHDAMPLTPTSRAEADDGVVCGLYGPVWSSRKLTAMVTASSDDETDNLRFPVMTDVEKQELRQEARARGWKNSEVEELIRLQAEHLESDMSTVEIVRWRKRQSVLDPEIERRQENYLARAERILLLRERFGFNTPATPQLSTPFDKTWEHD